MVQYHLFPQYVPLPLFFAEDKLSFYQVMSDTQGYKHIHYVKDVSICFEYSANSICPRVFVAALYSLKALS